MSRGLLAALLLGLTAPPAAAQGNADARPRFGEGTHAFRRILFDRNFRPVADLAGDFDARRALIVVLGDTQPLEMLDPAFARKGGLRGFVELGGALLVATDRPSAFPLQQRFGVAVPGDIVRPARTQGAFFRDLPDCPFIVPWPKAEPALFQPNPLTPRGAKPLVASNLPGQLVRTRTPGEPLPALAVLPGPRPVPGRPVPEGPLLAVGGQLGAGRVLILADHSVFINDMMLQHDNGNIDFAYRCAEWLRGNDEPRDRCLYYEDGTVRPDFDIPLKPLPAPPIPSAEEVVPMLNQLLYDLEAENAFNDLLLGVIGEDNLWKGLAFLACTAVGGYGFVRLGLFRQKHETAVPSLAGLVATQRQGATLIDRRILDQLHAGNFWEAARDQARQLFASGEPAVEVRGGWWQRRRWGRRIGRLWRLAASEEPWPVSRRQFAAVTAEVERARAALADGTLRLTS